MKYGWLALALCGGTLLAGPAFGQESSAGTIELSVQVEGTAGVSTQPNSNGSDSHIATATHRQHLVLKPEKHGQPAKPFLKPAKSASKNACIEAMKAKLESEMGNV